MTSPVFWLSFAAVFLLMRWLADGILSGARVKVRRLVPASKLAAAQLAPPQVQTDESWPASLDEAA